MWNYRKRGSLNLFYINVCVYITCVQYVCVCRVFSQIKGSLPIAGLGKGIKNFVYFERYVDIFFPRVEVVGLWLSCPACGCMDGGWVYLSHFCILHCIACGGLWSVYIGK